MHSSIHAKVHFYHLKICYYVSLWGGKGGGVKKVLPAKKGVKQNFEQFWGSQKSVDAGPD